MKFKHEFRVRAPLAAVANFHSRADSMAAITPPLVPVQMKQAPPRLGTGDEMAFTMWLGPLPVRWRAHIDQASSTGFRDYQLEGPFRYWLHRHTFIPVDEQTTKVVDEVQAGLRQHPLWGPVGLGMWLGLPLLFAYRGWKTRRLLERQGAA
jgi:ligand-binding SRPBCC domain-containing protein